MTTAIVVPASAGVSGNIGSCRIFTSVTHPGSFYVREMSVNSCTGQLVADYTYPNWDYVYVPCAIVLGIVALIACVAALVRCAE
jgi:hypothetical protein